jgi:hypothetical protein
MTGLRARLLVVLASLVSQPAFADPALDALVKAYPQSIQGYDATHLILADGTRLPISDGVEGKTAEKRLDTADIDDQFVDVYPAGSAFPTPKPYEDPGRARNEALFTALYGNCQKGEVEKRLKTIDWLPKLGGGKLQVTTAQGVADKLAAASADLEKLPAKFHAYLKPTAGTYNCRVIAGTKRMSMHAYGAAVDINLAKADYWRWLGGKKETDKVAWRNQIPMEIVEVFERHGFIWGGKWYHFDTMHFEYRPEILLLAKPAG